MPFRQSKSQTGSINRKAIGSRKTFKRTLNPWGNIFPQRGAGKTLKINRVSRGSSTRKSTPDPSLFKMPYPANKPYAWPVEIDTVGHTSPAAGHTSGYTAAVITRQNTETNHAFKRAGYPEA